MPGSSWIAWLHSRPPEGAIPPASLDQIRLQVLAAVADCCGTAAERVRMQVRKVRSGSDLLLLRGDIYQLVACEHCEAEARRRINELLPALKGRVPAAASARF
jgi:hypothetical protein